MRSVARIWFAVTALVVLAGVMLQVAATADQVALTAPAQLGRVFMSFTVLANLLVAGTGVLLAVDPDRDGSAVHAVRLGGLVSVVLGALVFHAALLDLQDLAARAAAPDLLLHTVSPLLSVLGWMLFGPRGRFDGETVVLALVGLVGWLVFTLARGVSGDAYPYAALDAGQHGYPQVLLACLLVVVAFAALAGLFHLLDRRLPALSAAAP